MEKLTSSPENASNHSFWLGAAVYQIYPWTFNEDEERQPQRGNGSIRGITERLEYLSHLGVNVIWISPFYPSPMIDGGYDIQDYRNIHPDLGTLADFDVMAATARGQGIKTMIDFVPNHTSDQHEWFLKSRSSRDNDKADWYIWHDGIEDDEGERHPPNNWASVFSLPQLDRRRRGEMPELHEHDKTPPISAWTFDEQRGQYYLHSFTKEQPDLNWNNPAVREEMKATMRFWLDRGVDGFRVDAVNYIGKDRFLADEPLNDEYVEGIDNPYDQLQRRHSAGYPDTFYPYIEEMSAVLRESQYEGRDPRIIFEAYMDERSLETINRIAPEVAGTFNFGAMDLPWEAQFRKAQLDDYYHNLPEGVIANQVNGNHDKPRLVSRIGPRDARAAAVHNLMLPGIPFIYNGEELGLTDAVVPEDRQKDPNGGRDPERTPIPWDSTRENAGFSHAQSGQLYLPLNEADLDKCADLQLADPKSSFALYHALLGLRSTSVAAKYGTYKALYTDDRDVLGFSRRYEGSQVIVLTNFSHREKVARLHHTRQAIGRSVLSSVTVKDDRLVDFDKGVSLAPHEAIVVVRAMG